MYRRVLFALLALVTATVQMQAQARLSVNATYNRLEPLFQQNVPSAPLYEPFVFPMNGGELGMMIQGNCGG
ncbi:MAG TPA: hypothetical protein VF911_00580, partial [Thermoanaerobaculia bacterium]